MGKEKLVSKEETKLIPGKGRDIRFLRTKGLKGSFLKPANFMKEVFTIIFCKTCGDIQV